MGVVERLESKSIVKEIREHLLLLGFRGEGMDRAVHEVVGFCRASWVAASLEQVIDKSLEGVDRENTLDVYERLLPSYLARVHTKRSEIYTELAQVFAEYLRPEYR